MPQQAAELEVDSDYDEEEALQRALEESKKESMPPLIEAVNFERNGEERKDGHAEYSDDEVSYFIKVTNSAQSQTQG